MTATTDGRRIANSYLANEGTITAAKKTYGLLDFPVTILADKDGNDISAANPLPVSAAISGTVDTELPAATLLANGDAIPTAPKVGSVMMGKNDSGTLDLATLATVEVPGSYNTGLVATNKGVDVNSRAHQIWDASHVDNAGSGADGKWYSQNQDPNGNLLTALSSIRGKLLRFRGAAGTTISGTNPPPIVTGGYGSTSAPAAVTSGRAVDRWHDLNGRGAVFADAGAFADGALATLGLKADAKSTATDTTAVTIMQVLKQISASVQAPPSQAVTNAGTFAVQIAPATSGGWSVGNFTSGDTFTALTNTAQVIKGSAGSFGGYYCFNPNTSTAYINVYDVAAASVTVGTTTPKLNFALPAGAAANIEISAGIPFATAMSISATTTGGGSTAPTTPLEVMVWYK